MAQQCRDAKEIYSGPLPAVHSAQVNGNGSSSYEVVSGAAPPGAQFTSPPVFNTDPTGFDPAREHYSRVDLINDNSPTESCPTQAQIPNGNTMDCRQNRKCDSLNFFHMKRNASELNTIEEGTENTDKPFVNRSSSISGAHVCVILVFVAVSVMFLVFVMKVQQQMEYLQTKYDSLHMFQAQTEQESNVCLHCTEVERGTLPEDTPELKDLVKRVENGQEMCCAKTNAQVALLLFLQRKHLENCALDQQSNSCNNTASGGSVQLPPTQPLYGNVSAHLQAGSQLGNLGGYQSIQNWLDGQDAPGTHLTNIKMSPDKKYLVIPSTGRYFLYSQVGFLVYYNKGVTEQGPRSLFLFVYRKNHIYPTDQILLRSDITQCWEENKDYGRYTSYVGASVLLNKGDKIYVKVSQIELLSRGEPSLTYFGLFKMG